MARRKVSALSVPALRVFRMGCHSTQWQERLGMPFNKDGSQFEY